MIESYKGRELKPGDRVAIYRNLHRPGVWFSVRDVKTGRVVAHATRITVRDVTFKVSAAGRAKVLATGHKNVHAFVVGTYDPEIAGAFLDTDTEVTYNPRKYETFVDKRTGEKLTAAASALVSDRYGVVAVAAR